MSADRDKSPLAVAFALVFGGIMLAIGGGAALGIAFSALGYICGHFIAIAEESKR